MARPCVTTRSAIAPRRRRASSSSATSGSPPTLALVATSAISLGAWRQPAKSGAPARACSTQPMQRRIGEHEADVGEFGATLGARTPRLLARTIGRGRDCKSAISASPSSASSAALAAFGTIMAKGLASRALRRRNFATAASLRASQTR